MLVLNPKTNKPVLVGKWLPALNPNKHTSIGRAAAYSGQTCGWSESTLLWPREPKQYNPIERHQPITALKIWDTHIDISQTIVSRFVGCRLWLVIQDLTKKCWISLDVQLGPSPNPKPKLQFWTKANTKFTVKTTAHHHHTNFSHRKNCVRPLKVLV